MKDKNNSFRMGEIFCFALWFVPLYISAVGEKHFSFPSGMLLNAIGARHVRLAVVPAALVLLVYLRSFSVPKVHRLVCALIFIDAMLGAFYRPSPPFVNDIYFDDYAAFFWKTALDRIGIGLDEDVLYQWGAISFSLLPALVAGVMAAASRPAELFDFRSREKGVKPKQPMSKNMSQAIKTVVGVLVFLLVGSLAVVWLTGRRPVPRGEGLSPYAIPGGRYERTPFSPALRRAYDVLRKGDPNAACAIAEREARKGDANAMAFLSEMYFETAGPVTKADAHRYLRDALARQNLYALRVCARQLGHFRTSDGEEFSLFLLAAENGDVYSMERVGLYYLRGIGTKRNRAEGLRWILRGAESGNKDAMLMLGRIYYQGDLAGRDLKTAHRWLTRALVSATAENDTITRNLAEKYLIRIDRGLLPHQ